MIAARKLSSAMSAAKAICDHMRDWWFGTPEVRGSCHSPLVRPNLTPPPQGEFVSMGVVSDGSYGIPKDLLYSVPVRIKPDRTWQIVEGLSISDFAREKMDITTKELEEERELSVEFLSSM